MRWEWKALLVVSFLFAACSSRRPSPAASADTARTVERHWKQHEQVLERVLSGGKLDPAEYERAVEFFEETTGIPASDRQTYVGRLPGPKLGDDLNAWREWYGLNREALYWDSENARIRIRQK